MKLHWFSPVPPARSGISEYALGVLPSLCERAEVVIWTDQAEVDPRVAALAEVRRYSRDEVECRSSHGPLWKALNEGAACVYHLGNNARFHETTWRLSRRYPGVVVVHDLSCQHLFREVHHRDPRRYVLAMAAAHGEEGRRAAEEHLAGRRSLEDLSTRFPMLGLILHGALSVVTHTPQTREAARWLVPAPVAYHPLPAPARPLAGRQRRAEGPRRVILLGLLGRNRRVEAFLRALARAERRSAFEVDIHGEHFDPVALVQLIHSLGLAGQVRFHGFTAEAEVERALSRADLAVNLRYPSMGEASATQLRFWEHALPTLVTRTGWYGTLPESVVGHVRPEHEERDLLAHLSSFLDHPEAYEDMGRRGRRWFVQHHAPASYAETLIRAATATAPRRVEAARRLAGQRVMSRLAGFRSGAAVVRPAVEALWPHAFPERLVEPLDALAPRVKDMLGRIEARVAAAEQRPKQA
jgi:glycosyltransferase involved in cell wall biosynthesis